MSAAGAMLCEPSWTHSVASSSSRSSPPNRCSATAGDHLSRAPAPTRASAAVRVLSWNTWTYRHKPPNPAYRAPASDRRGHHDSRAAGTHRGQRRGEARGRQCQQNLRPARHRHPGARAGLDGPPTGRVRQHRGAERLRQEHPVQHHRRADPAEHRPGAAGRAGGHRSGRADGLYAPEGPAAAVEVRAGERLSRPGVARRTPQGCARTRPRAAPPLRPRRLRAALPARYLRRHAAAGGADAHLPLRRRRAAARRAVRRTRRPDPHPDAAVAAGDLAGGPPHRAVRHPRRGRGDLPFRSGAADVQPAGHLPRRVRDPPGAAAPAWKC